MTVYRICKEQEIEQIMEDKSFDNVGKACEDDPKINTHHYEKGKKYIHFFEDYDNLFYLNVTEGYCICTYDIPKEVLEDTIGVGYYLDRIFMIRLESAMEYAIENKQMKFEYLQKVEEIRDSIDIEDFIESDYKGRIRTIYDNTKKEKVYEKK